MRTDHRGRFQESGCHKPGFPVCPSLSYNMAIFVVYIKTARILTRVVLSLSRS